jgi:hypothetical protein
MNDFLFLSIFLSKLLKKKGRFFLGSKKIHRFCVCISPFVHCHRSKKRIYQRCRLRMCMMQSFVQQRAKAKKAARRHILSSTQEDVERCCLFPDIMCGH